MPPDNRLMSLVVEMVGSVAICGLTFAAELLIDARRRGRRMWAVERRPHDPGPL